MSKWNIYHKDGSFLTDANGEQITVSGLEYSDSWMGECFVTISFKNNAPINFQIGDYLEYRGERFELNYDPGKEKQARKDSYGEAFVYDSVKFTALQDELTRTEFLDVVLNDNELHYTALPKFSFYVETLDDLLDRLQANLNEQIGEGKWKIFSRNKDRSEQRGCTEEEWNDAYGEGTLDITIDSKSLTVDTKKCWEALALVNSEWDVNFIVRGRNIYVGTAGVPTANIFKYGLGNGLYEVDQNADSDQSITTRLRAYGSEQNLPSHYYADLGIKYKCNITKVINATSYVELLFDLDFVESYFKNQRTYTIDGKSNSLGWVLQVTFDFKTIITGYITDDSDTKKCRFYSEIKGNQDDSGDEPSQDNLNAFIAQVKDGNTLLYISNGVDKSYIPSANKEYADNLPNNMAINRLMLPGFPRLSLKEYYDALSGTDKAYVNPNNKAYKFSTDKYRPYIDSPNIDEIGLRSGSQFFDTDDKTNGVIEIYPTIEEMEIGGVRVDEINEGVAPDDDGRFEDGQTVANVDIYLSPSIDFDITGLKNDDFAISMKDGMCGGRTFTVAATNKVNGRWRLTIERVKDDALDLYFPYKDYPIRKGDHFVLTGIELPDSYVNAASLKLLKYALALLDKNDYTRYVYQPKVDEIFMARQHDASLADKTGTIKSLHDTLKAGDIMLFEDDDLSIDAQISIDQLSIKEEDGKIPTYEVTLREDKEVGTIQKIQQQISSLESGNGGTGGGGATIAQIKSQVVSEGSKHFLSKLYSDTAQGIITFLQGLKIGDTGNNEITTEGLARLYAFITYGFQSGLYGTGAQIDHKGNAELNSLFVRQFISTPKFVFNEIAVTKAEQWNTNGYGTIESVDLENQQITLKLEENDYGSLSEGDICRGIFADIDNAYGSDSTTEGALDEQGFVMHKGFFTTYFYVKRIITSEKGKFVFEYGKKSTSTPDPCAYMDFAQYGSFTDDQRQSSMYFSSRGRSYIEVLDGVNTWEIKSWNRVCRYGYLGGLSLQKKDGSYFYPNGNGLYAQDNVYFGGTVTYLKGIEGLDDIKEEAKSYDVSLSQYQSVLTVDDMGNVIDGLYSVDEGQSIKQYKVTTAVFVRKGQDILLEEDDSNEDVTEGHYRVYAVSNECTVEIKNSTVFVTAIENIKDGVAGTDDDTDFDYDQMRKMTDAMVTIVVDLEGKTSKTVQMPIRIQHDSLPFMVCDLSNENASVAWNTKTSSYIGFPIETKVSLFYQNTPYTISSLNINTPAGLKASMSLDGKAKTITVEPDNLTSDSLPQVSKLEITVTGVYAGASYEYTKELTVVKTADTVVYEVVPSADNVTVDASDNMSTTSLSCRVFATSSDDKRYELTSLPSGFALKYAYDSDTPTTSLGIGKSVSVGTGNTMVTFGLYDASGNELDKESVPVVKDGKKGADGAKGDKGDTGRGISSVTTRYYTNSSSTSAPSSSSFFSSSSSDTTPADWGDSYPWLWKLVRTYYTDGTYSDAIVCVGYKAKDGSTGSDGRGIVSVDTYYLISASNTGVDLSTTGWSTSMVNPTSSKPYLWSYVKTTYSDQTSDRSTPVIIGNFAEAGPMGKMGCTVRTSIWQSGVEYHNDSALTTEPKYIDVVYVENSSANGGYDVYQCETTHTSSGSAFSYDTSKWTKLSDVGPIYSPLIVAKNAAIKFSQSQQINLVSDGSIWGSLRHPSGQDGDESKWSFWLGGSTASSAPFRIDKDGNLYCESGIYNGSMRSPFKGVGVGLDNVMTDNLSLVGYTTVNFPSAKESFIGRLIHLVNYKYGGTTQSGTCYLEAPSGYSFFEDGVAKSEITVSRECVTLLGLGDGSNFYGWLVLDRVDINTTKKYGHCKKVLAYGTVTGTSSSASVRCQTFNGSSMSVSRTGTGIYRLSCPSSWFGNDTSKVFVMLTGVGYCYDDSTKTQPIKATLWGVTYSSSTMYIEVHTSDDATPNDGSFNFEISNYEDFAGVNGNGYTQ